MLLSCCKMFELKDITHVDGTVDPVRDFETIDVELRLADLESIEKDLTTWQKKKQSLRRTT